MLYGIKRMMKSTHKIINLYNNKQFYRTITLSRNNVVPISGKGA